MAYVSLCKALYDYVAVAEDELSFTEDALLYILDASDEEWWKAKKLNQGQGQEEEEEGKVGLIPANYVEEAMPIRQSRALYDYAAQTHEEVHLKEDQLLNVYQDDDDWILVRSADDATGKLGFVPKNYVDQVAAVDGETGLGAPIDEATATSAPDQEAPQTYASPPATPLVTDKGDAIQMWSVNLLDGKKKKRKGTLGIGNASLFFASESDKQPVQKISITHVRSHTVEAKGKQINLDLDEAANVEDNSMRFLLTAKGEAEQVAEKIQASKTRALTSSSSSAAPTASKATPRLVPPPLTTTNRMSTVTTLPPPSRGSSTLPPPPQRAPVSPSPSAVKTNGHSATDVNGSNIGEAAIALYDFEAQGDDELSVAENETLRLIERENDDWWKVRNAAGQEGVVPASYVEVTPGTEEVDADDNEIAAAAAEEEEERQRQVTAMEATRRTKEAAARRAREAEERRREALKAQPAPAPPKAAPLTTTDSARAAISIPAGRSAPARPAAEATAGGKTRPNPARTRVWVDRTGAFKVEAEFLGFNQGKIRLHKLNGVVIEVAVEKMSNADIAYLEDVTGKRLASSSTTRASAGTRTTSTSALRPATGEREREKRREAEREARRRQQSSRTPKRNVDWFEFFLAAGVDVDDCTRYAAAFERDNIDEAILPDMEPGVLRSLGLREGDIIRVDKFIRRKYRREEASAAAAPSKDREAQLKADEELARKLQGQEQSARRGASTSPAPNLFSGPDGSLKNNTRRGRPAAKGTAQGVDAASIAAVAEDLARTQSPPQLPTRSSNNSPAIVASAGAARKSTATPSGFDDDAWTPRPSSTKPATPAATAPPVASPAPAPVAPTPPPAPAAPVVAAAAATSAASPAPAPADPNSALFDKLAAMRPPSGFAQRPGASPLGAGASPVSSFMSARGPLAPVVANQGLLQPLISTHGTGQFVPTRGGGGLQAQATGWGGMQAHPTGFGQMQMQMQQPMQTGFGGMQQQQPIMQTGFGGIQSQQPMQTGFGGMGMSSPGVAMMQQPQQTGFHPGVGISNVSGFGGGMLAPQMTAMPPPPQQQQVQMQPQATGIQLPQQSQSGDKFGAANIFGQMKQGTLHQDPGAASQPPQRYDALRPQPTGFQPGGVMGINPQFTSQQQQQPPYGQQGYGYQQY